VGGHPQALAGAADHRHRRFTGFRGDLAFAVLVLSGETSAPALSVTGTFLGSIS
jgi:hypothetical protein